VEIGKGMIMYKASSMIVRIRLWRSEGRGWSAGIGYSIFINKSMGFSQSLLEVPAGGDIIWQKPNITRVEIN